MLEDAAYRPGGTLGIYPGDYAKGEHREPGEEKRLDRQVQQSAEEAIKELPVLCDLMDAAYDAKRIDETSRQLGHVPIMDRNGRGQEVIPMAPHEAERYKIRSGAERAQTADLKKTSAPATSWSRGTAR